jgi:hypothetical protein
MMHMFFLLIDSKKTREISQRGRHKVMLLLLLSFFSGLISAVENWTGDYAYVVPYGISYSGSPIAVEYLIKIRAEAPLCEIEISGFQTFEEITCGILLKRKSIELTFLSYKSGDQKNAYGIPIYESGQTLITLEWASRMGKDVLLTRWHETKGLDGKKLNDGQRFKLIKLY